MKRFLTIIVLLGALWPLSALGAFELQPRLTVREEFTDNLYLDDRDEESDFITTLHPGVLLQYRARLLEINLDYSLRFLQYLHHSEEDETSLKDTQRVLFNGLLFPEKDFTVSLHDEYQRVVIDNRRQVDDDNPIVNRSNRNSLVINPQYRTRRFATLEPTIGYRFETVDYDHPEGDDFDSHEVYVDLRKQLNTKLDLTLGGRQQFYRADEEEDFDRLDVTGRIDYRFSSALTLRAGGGSGWINYEGRNEEQAMLWDVGLNYQPGSRWLVGVAYREDFSLSVDDGLSRSKRLEATFSYLERLPTTLQFYSEKQKYQTEDREDRGTGGSLRVSVPFAGRLSLDLTGEASVWRFLPEDEDVFRYGAGLAASYGFRFGTFTVGYRYRASNSDLDSNDYKSNVVYVQATLAF